MNWLSRKRLLTRYTAKYRRMFRAALSEQLKSVGVETLDLLNYKEKISNIKNEKLTQTYIKLYKEVGVRFASQRIKEIRLETNHKELKADPEVFEGMIIQYAQIAENIVDVTNFSKEIMFKAAREALTEGLDEGYSLDQIIEAIRRNLKADFNTMSTARAFRIALTEVGIASNTGAYVGLQEAAKLGVNVRKVWLTAPVGISKTERHTLLEPGLGNQRPKLDGYFNVGGARMLHPGHFEGGAANVINCKCALSWEVMDENHDIFKPELQFNDIPSSSDTLSIFDDDTVLSGDINNTVRDDYSNPISIYTGGGYRGLNNELRYGKYGLGDDYTEFDNALNKVLTDSEKYKGTTYRGLYFDNKDEYIKVLGDYNINGVVTDRGYMSTSKNSDIYNKFKGNYNIRLEIDSKRGVDISDISEFKNEQEVLFKRDSKFIVNDIIEISDEIKLIKLIEI